jgi:patatin-like phospholipase/acyl hydrolase
MSKELFRILSLDGGGTRGYFSALALGNIETYLNKRDGVDRPLGTYFDLIAGTSTGAIIALALALGMQAREIAKFYEDNIPLIFKKGIIRNVSQFFRPIYDADDLTKCVSRFFGDATLAHVKTDVCVVCTSLQNAKPRLYKSDYLVRNAGRLDERLADIAVASSAAPVYFKAHSLRHSTNLVDGGLCANNPSIVGLVEALQFERISKRGSAKPSGHADLCLLSIGTGEQCGMPYNIDSVKEAGVLNWLKIPSTPLLEVVFQSQSQLVHFQAQFLMKEKYFRINPLLKFPMKLDDTRRLFELKNLADVTREIEVFLNTYVAK